MNRAKRDMMRRVQEAVGSFRGIVWALDQFYFTPESLEVAVSEHCAILRDLTSHELDLYVEVIETEV